MRVASAEKGGRERPWHGIITVHTSLKPDEKKNEND